jgi:membrane-bound serine protease (ClpP class)
MFTLIAVLILAGGVLLFVELFVPGMIAGVCGGLAGLAALGLKYSHYGVDEGNMVLAGVLIAAMIGFAWWMRAFPETRIARRWMLAAEVPPAPEQTMHAALIGRSGQALTTLRPAGIAVIDKERLTVVAEGALIDAGARVEVIRVEGPKVIVRERTAS